MTFDCIRLGKNGSQMIFPYRGEHYKMMRLKCVGDLGQVRVTKLYTFDVGKQLWFRFF